VKVKRKNQQENLDVDGRISKTGLGNMDWINVAQDRDKWRALVSMVMKIRLPPNVEKFLSSCMTGGFS
jgi:hypothetical protein